MQRWGFLFVSARSVEAQRLSATSRLATVDQRLGLASSSLASSSKRSGFLQRSRYTLRAMTEGPDHSNAAPVEISLPENLPAATVIDAVSLLFPDLSRAAWTRLFAAGRVRAASRPVAMQRAVSPGMEITIQRGWSDVERIDVSSRVPFGVLDETKDWIVVAKPTGVPVLPTRGGGASMLGELVAREIESRGSKSSEDYVRPRIVHRLDRDTSGLLVVAKTLEAERRLGAAFEARRVEKTYFAKLEGCVVAARTHVSLPIARGRGGRMRIAPSGRFAMTVFDVLDRSDGYTFVRASPKTGRTHQIRLHARAIGHSVVGDSLYGSQESAPSVPRLALHAARYSFRDLGCAFECPPPPEAFGHLAEILDGHRPKGNRQ